MAIGKAQNADEYREHRTYGDNCLSIHSPHLLSELPGRETPLPILTHKRAMTVIAPAHPVTTVKRKMICVNRQNAAKCHIVCPNYKPTVSGGLMNEEKKTELVRALDSAMLARKSVKGMSTLCLGMGCMDKEESWDAAYSCLIKSVEELDSSIAALSSVLESVQ